MVVFFVINDIILKIDKIFIYYIKVYLTNFLINDIFLLMYIIID